jgi:hypothetical protein
METTKLPLTKWFQASYLVWDAKAGISSLSLMRKLSVNYRTEVPISVVVRSRCMVSAHERTLLRSIAHRPRVDGRGSILIFVWL